MTTITPPRDGLVRASQSGFELRAASNEGGMPTLFGYMLRFNEWTEIDSVFEGRFMERIAPGAAKKTLLENTGIRILFNHGKDPSVGERALTAPNLVEDSSGVRYEGELFDTTYNRDLVPGLQAGQYGSSFRFRVVKEEFVRSPARSEHNPEGIPERTVEELEIREGGPVTFPAYAGAAASVRSMTDHFFLEELKGDPTRAHELDELFTAWVRRDPDRVRSLLVTADRAACAYMKTGTSTAAWDGEASEARISNDAKASTLRTFYAWEDPAGNPDAKASYRFGHHEVSEDGTIGDANLEACSAGIAVLNGGRGGTTIPDADRQGVYDHLAHHLRDAGREPPELRSQGASGEPPQALPEDGESRSDSHSTGAEGPHSGESRATEALYGLKPQASDEPAWKI